MAKVFTITEGLENLGALKTGGQGSVYKGRRIGEIITAIKLLPTPIYSESADDKNFIAFENEVQKLKKVNEETNPNVVKILSWGITDSGNFPYIEMEFIEGPDLEELLKSPHDPVFTIKEVLRVADHLSNALAHCHKVGVRHGDIKSNNVKYNASTGNYMLLDFGLSVMSDEQRRTSIRNAGAIEFMAPEQNEGLMLFETDVYSFGIILFELLAGHVPFPLNDRGETARNKVMVAHLETLPPDMLSLRERSIPSAWNEQKKKDEMEVPDWLTNMIYKCLEKKPGDRFAHGMELHKYIWEHTFQRVNNSGLSNESVSILEQENKRLRREKERLQQQLLHYEQLTESSLPNLKDATITTNNSTPVDKTTLRKSPSKTNFYKKFILTGVALIVLSGVLYVLTKNQNITLTPFVERKAIGEYRIASAHAYVYESADINTRTNSFGTAGNENVKAFEDKNGFLFTEITDQKGKKLKGWVRKQDLVPLNKSAGRNSTPDVSDPGKREIAGQLQNAQYFFKNGKNVEALIIYSSLAKQEVPEAMYQYGKLSLQNLNPNITCSEAFNLIKRAEEKGYIPAKRTLGFLYSFADNKDLLRQNNYFERCSFGKNLKKGSQLLMEATLAGDTTASRLLDELNRKIK
jgi:serine/threonine-protein kinase